VSTRFGPWSVTTEGATAHVVIDHPPTNLVDGALLGGLRELLDCFAQDAPRAVLFTSADPDFFLMHGDVEQLASIPPKPHRPTAEPNLAAATFQRVRTAPYVSIGLVDGAARGGGAEFLAALDLRIASPRAVLGQPEVAMGILPGAGGTARLGHLLGRARALEVIITGRDVDAHEALSIGWIDEVVAVDQLHPRGLELAHRIAAMPAAGIAAVKRVIDESLRGGIDAGLVAESNALGELMAAGAHRTPMRRFLDAGGQTRKGETMRMAAIVDAMLEP
jgi:enoyl-CoA hydratase/carnithine racemase